MRKTKYWRLERMHISHMFVDYGRIYHNLPVLQMQSNLVAILSTLLSIGLSMSLQCFFLLTFPDGASFVDPFC